ncbi:MAG: hypothetical protein LBV16_08220 [Elusimicrobiota bacterium]|nr:hypothetical protein [Elusimicrobiota bacterium]
MKYLVEWSGSIGDFVEIFISSAPLGALLIMGIVVDSRIESYKVSKMSPEEQAEYARQTHELIQERIANMSKNRDEK